MRKIFTLYCGEKTRLVSTLLIKHIRACYILSIYENYQKIITLNFPKGEESPHRSLPTPRHRSWSNRRLSTHSTSLFPRPRYSCSGI